MIAVAVGLRRHGREAPVDNATSWLATAYAEPHELVQVSSTAFPDADLEYYDLARGQLEREGYRWLGDIEDLSLSRLSPETRTFMRVMVDAGGMIRAAVYHVRPRGMIVLLQAALRIPRELRVVELVTEVRGRFLSTSNTQHVEKLDIPPEVLVERLPMSTPIAKLVAQHQQRVAEHLREHPEQLPVVFEGLPEVLSSVARGNEALGRFWRKRAEGTAER